MKKGKGAQGEISKTHCKKGKKIVGGGREKNWSPEAGSTTGEASKHSYESASVRKKRSGGVRESGRT